MVICKSKVIAIQGMFLILASYGDARMPKVNDLLITGYKNEYDSGSKQQILMRDKVEEFCFERFQSPNTIKSALGYLPSKSTFKWHQGKDGRKGYVSSTKLVGDWVLAESEQVAVKCTTKEVLQAYLSGELQRKWNEKEVLECKFERKRLATPQQNESDFKKRPKLNYSWRFDRLKKHDKQSEHELGNYYQQNLVLRSQRIIRSHTGIMRYSQIITIDKIGQDSYAVLVRLDPEQQQQQQQGFSATTTNKKPFESLSVYVGLQQNRDNVDIYAAGVMKVNRKVVPKIAIFDASGIAGSMAGKGTLWLAGFFDQRLLSGGGN